MEIHLKKPMNHAFLFDNTIPFEQRALRIFSFQYDRNPVFRRFSEMLDVNPENIVSTEDIPMLPVEAFRDAECTCWPGEKHDLVFRSSGTTGMRRSRHPVKDAGLYAESVEKGMSAFYNVDEYIILAYTPGYAENPDSSLVWMLNHLVGLDRSGLSRFLLVEKGMRQVQKKGQAKSERQGQKQGQELNYGNVQEQSRGSGYEQEQKHGYERGQGHKHAQEQGHIHEQGRPPRDLGLNPDEIARITASGKKLMLFGAAFGLIDMAEASPVTLPAGSVIVETGGMKTHRREMGREEMHTKLATAFGLPVENIHSEYGMTELLSQAWMQGDGVFRCPQWMCISVHDPDNPLERLPDGREGLIGITDLANLNSCSFLMTGDAGVRNPDGSFRVLGRMPSGNLRGCNFLLEED
jgi:hypothetical protein